MNRGIQGTFVIAWSQIFVDGMNGLQPEDLDKGARWMWKGEPVRVDGPSELLLLGDAVGQADMRQRAAKVVKKLVGATLENKPVSEVELDQTLSDTVVVLTDGRTTYTMTLVEIPAGQPLAMFVDGLPPRDQDLWVVEKDVPDQPPRQEAPKTGGLICFTDTTYIRTHDSFRMVQDLKPGDLVQTRDNGNQPILWIGKRRVSGARLHVMPQMRPIRVKAHAFGEHQPGGDILVSPQHRMLVKGRVALDLFNEPEVLVQAKDLINGRSIYSESRVREVTYYHILFERHEVLWANGVESESFHPGRMQISTLEDDQRQSLLALFPDLEWNTDAYGEDARRSLSQSEAVILQFAG